LTSALAFITDFPAGPVATAAWIVQQTGIRVNAASAAMGTANRARSPTSRTWVFFHISPFQNYSQQFPCQASRKRTDLTVRRLEQIAVEDTPCVLTCRSSNNNLFPLNGRIPNLISFIKPFGENLASLSEFAQGKVLYQQWRQFNATWLDHGHYPRPPFLASGTERCNDAEMSAVCPAICSPRLHHCWSNASLQPPHLHL
jgi:hypothetical protein